MSKNGKKVMSVNTHCKILYSPEFSSIMVTYFNLNLAFHFYQYLGKDRNGMNEYDKNSITASVNYDGAALLYLTAMSILDGTNSDKEIKATVSCNKATLAFDYRREQDNQMAAYLVIEKDNQLVPFKFTTHTRQVKKDGQVTTEVVQTGLSVFAKMLDGYLTGAGALRHLDKMSEFYKTQEENPQGFYSAGNNSGYQRGSW